MFKAHCRTQNMARKLKNMEKREKHNVGFGKWQKKWKNVENETQTVYELEYGVKE